MPKMGENTKLTGGKSASEFFKARAENKDCQNKMADWEKRNEEAYGDMMKAKAAGSPETDKLEKEWRNIRLKQLAVVETCGPCVTAKVVKTAIPGTERNETWYVAEGACLYSEKAPLAETAYANALKTLMAVEGYGKPTGGFDPMVEFLPFDKEKKELLKGVKEIASPSFAILGMRAAEAFGLLIGYRQIVEIAINGDKTKEAQITFKGSPVPGGIKLAELVDYTVSGAKKKIKPYPLQELQASWYLTASGYVHYYMAGEFGSALPFAEQAGREAAQEVLYTLYKRLK